MRAGDPRGGPPAAVDDDGNHVSRRGRESVLLLRRQGGAGSRTHDLLDHTVTRSCLEFSTRTRPHLVRRLRRVVRFRVALRLPLPVLRLVVLGVAVEAAADRVQHETYEHCAAGGWNRANIQPPKSLTTVNR